MWRAGVQPSQPVEQGSSPSPSALGVSNDGNRRWHFSFHSPFCGKEHLRSVLALGLNAHVFYFPYRALCGCSLSGAPRSGPAGSVRAQRSVRKPLQQWGFVPKAEGGHPLGHRSLLTGTQSVGPAAARGFKWCHSDFHSVRFTESLVCGS